ncbi:MAG TPA: hypothetical protein VNN77_06140 [candidate division Zixibacteria bacterium]|nr:hypothetical protein [candidate division Zixibacteria bacterium]
MKRALLVVLRPASRRFLLGALGTWCVLGPVVVLYGTGSAEAWLIGIAELALVACYAAVLVLCLRARWDALKAIVAETRLAMCSMIVGLLVNEITGLFVAVKYKLAVVYAFAGFVIAELVRPKGLKWTLASLFRQRGGRPDAGDGGQDLSSGSEDDRYRESGRPEWRRLSDVVDAIERWFRTSESRLEEAVARSDDAARMGAAVQKELGALKEELAENRAEIASLRAVAEQGKELESQYRELRSEGQRFQEELERQRARLAAGEDRLEEFAQRHRDLSERLRLLEIGAVELERRLEQDRARALRAVEDRLADLERRPSFYSQALESRIAELERELSGVKSRLDEIDAARERLRESGRTLRATVEGTRQLRATAAGRQAALPGPEAIAGDREVRVAPRQGKRGGRWPSLRLVWSAGTVAAAIAIAAGMAVTRRVETKPSKPRATAVAAKETTVEPPVVAAGPVAAPKARKKPAPQVRGTFETVRPTQVYSGPSTSSAWIADIGPGMKVHVVGSSYGWLEIRSKHGRPPGFIPGDAAVRVTRNG